MRHVAFVVLVLFAGGVVLASATEAPQTTDAALEKRVVFRKGDAVIEYSLSLARGPEEDSILGWLEFRSLSDEGALFLKWENPSAMRNDKELRVFFGYPYDRESAIPRMTFVKPGETLSYSFEIDCKGSCSGLRFIQIDLFMILDRVTWLRESMTSLKGDDYTLITPVGSEVWTTFYDRLVNEVITFPLALSAPPSDAESPCGDTASRYQESLGR